ncbi:MAG: ABC transporter permease [Chloroflexi bacterium]|nr:ABC transporter permease [Chloroflexota bacterium]
MAVAELDLSLELVNAQEEGQLAAIWKRFRRHKLALVGLATIAILISAAIFAPTIAPYDPLGQDLVNRNQSFSAAHIMGTDELGRDVFSRILFAGRISLSIGLSVAIFAEIVGMTLGAIAGYFGGWVDDLIARVVDLWITLPTLPILLILASFFKDGGVPMLILILVVFGWTGACRVVRGVVLSLRNQEFTEAARALGISHAEIIARHMLPNALAPIIVGMTLAVGGAIVTESALSFLGFGVQLPTATWGNMLQNAQSDMFLAPWKAVLPGFFIFITSLSFNFMGDGLRDALDPRMKI